MTTTTLLRVAVAIGAAGVCACAQSGPRGAEPPTPRPAVSAEAARESALAGTWSYRADVAGVPYTGTLDLMRDSTGWHGKLTDTQITDLATRSVQVTGDTVVVTLATGEGDVAAVTATLQADGTLAGIVATGGGQGTFSARKREATPGS